MRGDKLVIEKEHASVARQIAGLLQEPIAESKGKFVITIAGESGSGKTEIATVLSETLAPSGMKILILQQDDYFVYPPKTNEAMRRKNIGHVGTSEVKLDLLDRNLKDIIEGELQVLAEEIAYRIAEEVTGIDVKRVLDVVTAPATDERLNQIFGIDRSSGRFKGLLEFNNMAERVRATFIGPNHNLGNDKKNKQK